MEEIEIKQKILALIPQLRNPTVENLSNQLQYDIDTCYYYCQLIEEDGYIQLIDATSKDGIDALINILPKGKVFLSQGGYETLESSIQESSGDSNLANQKGEKKAESNSKVLPPWFAIAGVSFGGVTLLFFMTLALGSILGYEVPQNGKFLVSVVLSLGGGLSAHFIGGTAAAKGVIPIPFFKNHPVEFGLTGGIAVTVVLLILTNLFYVKAEEKVKTIDELFLILEDNQSDNEDRINAFLVLRDTYKQKDFIGRNLSGLTLPNNGWQGLVLTEANLKNCTIKNATFRKVNFVRANFSNANLSGSDFRESQLNGAIMNNADCSNSNFEEVMLRGGFYESTSFINSNLRFSDLEAANFKSANFSSANLYGADFNNGNDPEWLKSNLEGANFTNADLSSADLKNILGLDLAKFQNTKYDVDTEFPDYLDLEELGLIKL